MNERRYGDLELFGRMLRQARPVWAHILAIFLMTMLATPLALLAPVGLKIAVDSVVGAHPPPGFVEALLPSAWTGSDTALLFVAAGLMVAVAILDQVVGIGNMMLTLYTGERLLLDFRARLFEHVQRLSLQFHDTRGTSDSTYRIQYDAYSIQNILLSGLMPLFSAVFTVGAMLYVTFRIDWVLALVAIAVAPILLGVSQAYRRKLRAKSREVKEIESGGLGVIQEVLGSIRVVKAFGGEEREQERFVKKSSEGMGARLRYALLSSGFGALITVITAFGTATVLYVGVTHVQSGRLTLGDLILVMTYLSQLYQPLKTIAKKAGKLQSHLASAERAYALLDEVPDVTDRPGAQSLERARGAVAFEGVSFSYDGRSEVIKDVSFEVEPGARVGIAGRTGAGKSTLINLLVRFYDPSSGRITLDGADLRDLNHDDLRQQFAVVLQEPVLFAASIAENIAYARPGADEADVEVAARLANAHDFIEELPDGYATTVGERGLRLSGGERQRISIARAFLKDAPILVLDEPTSSIDTKTEATIIEAMERLMVGRTTFMIAHRLSTLENCDVRMEIEDGRLVSLERRDPEAVPA